MTVNILTTSQSVTFKDCSSVAVLTFRKWETVLLLVGNIIQSPSS